MNWEVFSQTGYLSVALWLGVPALWLLHHLWRPRRWVAHVAVGVAVAAIVLAEINSREYVAQIKIDHAEHVDKGPSLEDRAAAAFLAEKQKDSAQWDKAENAGQNIDIAGLDDADYERWKEINEKKKRSAAGADDDDLESKIGASDKRDGVEVSEDFEDESAESQVIMSSSDKALADRMDDANLKASRVVLLLALLFVVFDYVRRLNSYRESYLPLPVPSAWADALTPREPVLTLPNKPRRPVLAQLRHIVRRGEVFIYMTDEHSKAAQATGPMPRLLGRLFPIEVLGVNSDAGFDNEFVFETLWFGRNCFVVDDAARAQTMLKQFASLLAQRRHSRAHTRQTVHIVWDIAEPIDPHLLDRLAVLGRATGCTVLIAPKSPQPQSPPAQPKPAPETPSQSANQPTEAIA